MKNFSKTVIIQGSSRNKGDTFSFIEHMTSGHEIRHIDLLQYRIEHFDYNFKNQNDDFLKLITDLIDNYDTWIFASPVYWYSMSGIMKVFFDRLSDLLKIHKPLGRKLRGKSMAVLSVSSEDDIPDSFYEAFRLSSDYLGATYLGHCHVYGDSKNIDPLVSEKLTTFYNSILDSK